MEVNNSEVVAAVRRVSERYESGLVTASVAALDVLFWAAPRTVRHGADETLHGHAEITAFDARRPPLGPDRTAACAASSA